MKSYDFVKKLNRVRAWYRLGVTEQALFHELIELCNQSGWEDYFLCSNYKLCSLLNITEKTLIRARNELIQAGLISFRSGSSKRCGNLYSLVMCLKDPLPNENLAGMFPKICKKNADTTEPITEDSAGGWTGVLTEDLTEKIPDYIKTETKTKKTNKKGCVRDVFELFRKAYPGTKRGAATEFRNFRKKHPDHQEVVELLMPALEKFRQWRQERIRRGEFAPHYPHLSTWINQRRWETELETIQPDSHESEPPVVD